MVVVQIVMRVNIWLHWVLHRIYVHHVQSTHSHLLEALCRFNAGFFGNNGNDCTPCPVGTYKDVSGERDCIQCAKEKYSVHLHALYISTCTPCGGNSSSELGNSLLNDCTCNSGHYGPDEGSCNVCLKGQYKSVRGDYPCRSCGVGKYSIEYVAVAENTCQLCPSESTSDEGSESIYFCQCKAGFDGPDGGTCNVCPTGEPLSRSSPIIGAGGNPWACKLKYCIPWQ